MFREFGDIAEKFGRGLREIGIQWVLRFILKGVIYYHVLKGVIYYHVLKGVINDHVLKGLNYGHILKGVINDLVLKRVINDHGIITDYCSMGGQGAV